MKELQAQFACSALEVLIVHIDSTDEPDRADLNDLLGAFGEENDPGERRRIVDLMRDILLKVPTDTKLIPFPMDGPQSEKLKAWKWKIAWNIQSLRECRGLTQCRLAEMAGLNEDHIARLERAEHSAAEYTLEKISKALGVDLSVIQPSFE